MYRRARHLFLAVAAALAAAYLLAACGQKGDLFLPPPEAKATASRSAPKATAPAPAKTQAPAPGQPQPQGAGEGLRVLDEVPSTRPDLSGF